MSWKLVDCFYETNTLSQHQIDSYNIFIENNIQNIINNVGNIELNKDNINEGSIEFGKISINLPIHTEGDGQITKITPHEARLRNLTYSSSLFIDITYKSKNNIETFNNCFIGKIPIMIKSNIEKSQNMNSKECKLDAGGYFIISGSEKVLISQEKMNNNQIYVFNNNKQIESEIRSLSENDMKSTSTVKLIISKSNAYDNKLKVQLPFLKSDIPALYIFYMFDKSYDDFLDITDPDIKEFLLFSEIDLENAIETQNYCEKKLNIKSILSNEKKTILLNDNIHKNFFPHCNTINEKLFLFGLMITKTIKCFLKKSACDDRDHYKNKRIDTSGDLLSFLFKQLYKKLHKDMSLAAQKNYEQNRIMNISQLIKSKIITNGMKYSLATGNWGMSSNQGMKVGISQVLNRHSYLSTLSHLRRINSPIGKDGKVTLPRQLHGSHAYRICPCETPEGQQCGLVKNLALTCIISNYSYSDIIKKIVLQMDNLIDLDETYDYSHTKIFINGSWILSTSDPNKIITELKIRRSNIDFSSHVGLSFNKTNNEIQIHTDSGRCLRPLIVIENGKSNLTPEVILKIKTFEWKWNDLLINRIIEYIDSDEEESLLIAFDDDDIKKRNLEFTHCEIDKSLMLGICASLIPYSDHNQAPRNVYQSAMGKQAMGLYATNYQDRIDSFSHVLHYPQKPLVKTDAMDTFQFENMPSGVNAIVAIACYGGHNQEDSVIMNQSSIDRGLFRSSFYRTYKDEQKQQGITNKENFEKPNRKDCLGMSLGDYSKIEEDGLTTPGTFINDNDIIIGKTTTIPSDEKGYNKKDTSTSLRHNEQGVVDKVMLTSNEHGVCMTKTRVRSIRIPEMGDKFSSRHGQKGTIGITLPQEDMPFTSEGIVPDIIINPHAIPSRMTVAQLIECVTGKCAALNGNIRTATTFSGNNPEVICEELHKCGYDKRGRESMFSGLTGNKLEAEIFIGPTYYQRLKHMVHDKVHARARGPVQLLTRQPVEGRSKEGGLRFGEMERDCIISHGAAGFLKERLMDVSDSYTTCVCKTCGFMAVKDKQRDIMLCKGCKTSNGVEEIKLPYAAKLLFQELMSINIAPRIKL